MELLTPHNEAEILPTLSDRERGRYSHFKAGAQRVAEKHPDMDTTVYTDFLTMYLDNAREFKIKTKTDDGKPLDPRYVNRQLQAAEDKLSHDFTKKYPTEARNGASQEEIDTAAFNTRAVTRLRTEVEGEGLVDKTFKFFHDEEKGGTQWGNIVGGGIGAAIGALMLGSALGGLVGDGWLATIAMIVMGGAGLFLGAKLAGPYLNPEATPATSPKKDAGTPQKARAEEQEPEQEQSQSQSQSQSQAQTQATAAVASAPKPNTVFHPEGEHSYKRINLVQMKDGTNIIIDNPGGAQMIIDGHYSQTPDQNGNYRFTIANANVRTEAGNTGFEAVPNKIELVAARDKSIDFDLPANRTALNKIDDEILSKNARRGNDLPDSHSQKEEVLRLKKAVAEATILTHSPGAPTYAPPSAPSGTAPAQAPATDNSPMSEEEKQRQLKEGAQSAQSGSNIPPYAQPLAQMQGGVQKAPAVRELAFQSMEMQLDVKTSSGKTDPITDRPLFDVDHITGKHVIVHHHGVDERGKMTQSVYKGIVPTQGDPALMDTFFLREASTVVDGRTVVMPQYGAMIPVTGVVKDGNLDMNALGKSETFNKITDMADKYPGQIAQQKEEHHVKFMRGVIASARAEAAARRERVRNYVPPSWPIGPGLVFPPYPTPHVLNLQGMGNTINGWHMQPGTLNGIRIMAPPLPHAPAPAAPQNHMNQHQPPVHFNLNPGSAPQQGTPDIQSIINRFGYSEASENDAAKPSATPIADATRAKNTKEV